MPYFDGGRGRLHYRRQSVTDPAARVALLPGTGQHSGHYHRFGRALEAAGIELWTLDTAGHGLSEGDPDRPGTLPELAGDARAFLDLIAAEPGPLLLMGHSLGAATALAALDSGPRAATSGVATALSGLILCGTPRAVLLGQAPKSARGSENAAASRRNPDRTRAGQAAGPVVPEGVPVLIVHGVDDRRAPMEPVREWARGISADFREYPDAGHDLLHEPVQGTVTADIAEWIGAVVAR
ncbi:lysophospholipase [Nocardia sp. NBC_01503]|uniref:alpha/beta hydrolase n=1 Tax=Nocardia sp. NBC_01503 TaxID=2975997 RepID=UPI002E7B8632|nr:alpha/beta fold hydrolase [Nocardia sp. NBC_01503]WTL35893.1 lysophospholipase [Nocardia sp. NBC_01503]